jgi:hypothetical protein
MKIRPRLTRQIRADFLRKKIWIVDAHRGDRNQFVVNADEKLTAFLELESAIRACGELS